MAKISENKYLYRIMRFDHAVQVLKGALYFSHPSQWEDPYETHVKHSYDHAIFAQCWTTASMSDAMWRIYSPNFLGVRLRTRVGANLRFKWPIFLLFLSSEWHPPV